MISLPDVIQHEFFPESIKILYIKMQSALSMRGVLEGLSELLNDLESDDKTFDAYMFYFKRYQDLEKKDAALIKNSIDWIEQNIKIIQQGLSKNPKLKEFLKPDISTCIRDIQKGYANTPTYLQAMLHLLEKTVPIIASFGEEELLKKLGTLKRINISLPLNKDPLEHVSEKKEVDPFSPEGKKICQALGNGFISAKVLPPTEQYKANRYFIEQGIFQIDWPEPVKKIMKLNLLDWKLTLDISAARCLHSLICYSSWRDWLSEDLMVLGDNSKSSDINQFYNHRTMKEHIKNMFTNHDHKEIRNEIFTVLNRFLSVLLHEKLETRGKKNNKKRAEKYTYRIVKEILLPKTIEERKKFNNSIITDMIMDKVQEEDLSFNVTETNCIEACRLFEHRYEWPKKRQEDTKPRAKRSDENQIN